MKVILVIVGIIFHFSLFGQHYYVTPQNDTIHCLVLTEWPDFIRIKETDSKKEKITSEEMKCYLGSNVIMASKKIINQKGKDTLILLPLYTVENEIYTKNFEIKMIQGNGLTFYELKTYERPGMVFLHGNSKYETGRRFKIENYIESDSIGLSKIKYLTNPDDEQQKLDAINSVYYYLMSNKEIEKKLSVNGDYRNFTEKGLKKLIAEFMNRKLN